MNIDYHKQQTSPQMNQKNKSELGFFSKDKEADIAYQLNNSPIKFPKSSQSNSEKKPEKTQNTYHEPTFQGRVPLIEGFTQSESVPALNQRFQTRDRAKYDQTKEKLINQGSTDEYLFFQLAKTALDLYGLAIKTRIITLKKDSGYSGVEKDATFNRDEKLFQDWQNMLLPDISYRGPQQLQNIKKGSDMTKMLEKYNKFMKFKEDHKSSLEKISKYYEKIHSDNIPKYIDSISTLSQNLNSKQQEFDKQHQAIRDARRSLLKVLSPTAYGVATGVAGLYNAGVDYIGASAGYLWSFFESGIGYLIYDSDFNFESDIKSRFARVQKTQQMLKVSESSRQKSEFFGPDGLNITADNLIYQVSGGIMNMMSLLSGGQLIGQGLAKMGGAIGLKISQQIFMRGGLFTASFLLQVGPQFDEALNMGLDASKSFQYALLQSVVQSALELVSPNDLIMGRVGSAGIRDFIKNIGKEIFGENIQELSQLLAEKGLNYGANQVRDTQLDGVVSQGDIVNTVILTTLVTGLMAGSTGKLSSSTELVKSTQPDIKGDTLDEKKENTNKGKEELNEKTLELGRKEEQLILYFGEEFRDILRGLNGRIDNNYKRRKDWINNDKVEKVIFDGGKLNYQKLVLYLSTDVFFHIKHVNMLNRFYDMKIGKDVNISFDKEDQKESLEKLLKYFFEGLNIYGEPVKGNKIPDKISILGEENIEIRKIKRDGDILPEQAGKFLNRGVNSQFLDIQLKNIDINSEFVDKGIMSFSNSFQSEYITKKEQGCNCIFIVKEYKHFKNITRYQTYAIKYNDESLYNEQIIISPKYKVINKGKTNNGTPILFLEVLSSILTYP